MKHNLDIIWMAHTHTLPGSNTSSLSAKVYRIPLLTREEELALAQLVGEGHVAERKLAEQEAAYVRHPTRPGKTSAALMKAVIGGNEAKARLVFHNLRFAHWAAGISMGWYRDSGPIRYARPRLGEEDDMFETRQIEYLRRFARDTLPWEDRFQAGVIGLIASAELYQPNGKAKFVSYAGKAVYDAVTHAVLADRYRDGIRTFITKNLETTLNAQRRLRRLTGSEPSIEMLAADTDQGFKAVTFRLEEAATMPLWSLEQLFDGLVVADAKTGESCTAADIVWDPEADSAEKFGEAPERYEAIERALAVLSPLEFTVIRLRFGLEDGIPRTHEVISRLLGIRPERLRSAERKGLDRLRSIAREQGLRDYLDEGAEWPW